MIKHKIGLVYVPGALPCFEAFGRLPTNIVGQDGQVGNETASEALDMIIIPGGSLVESATIKGKLEKEIIKMADLGKIVLGICSGFQVLSNGTDIGQLSATPIIRKGLGLIDAEVSPLICTDQVKATIIGKSCLTDAVGKEVKGFHCHTYGNILAHKNAKPILMSHPNRVNYFKEIKELTSGIANQKGNVIGVFLHGLLDKNPLIIEGITKSLSIKPEELEEIRAQNAKLQEQMKNEIGILTNISPKITNSKKSKVAHTLLITALGSESGKTFFTTGLAGVLKKQGINVGVLKVGGDIRDAVPALYLIKEPMRDYSSIKISKSGWIEPIEAITQASKEYEFIIVEGAMSAFTGMLITQGQRPFSTAEVAIALGVPTVVIAGCTKEGIEGGIISAFNYVKLLKSLGANVAGVVLNKVHISYLSQEMRAQIEQAFKNLGVKLLGFIPRVDVEGRGAIPEVEIKYEEFCAKAVETIESAINLDNVLSLAKPAKPVSLDYEEIVKKFRRSIFLDCNSETVS
ncbi:MAG: AAA family ATPase [Crenarchaeota archaeon]|nr:AAA family ATPase [Thermoproteota archaeon]